MHSLDLRGYRVGLYDSQDRILAEYHGDRYGRDYMIVTPDRRVIAKVHKEEYPAEHYVCTSSDILSPHLVQSYVVLIDIISEELHRIARNAVLSNIVFLFCYFKFLMQYAF